MAPQYKTSIIKMLNKRGQTGGLITGLVFGIAALVIGAIIAFVVVSTLSSADLIDQTDRVTTTVTNEAAYINTTPYLLDNVASTNDNYQIVAIMNTTSGQTITSGNYTLSSLGYLTNASTTNWEAVSINYTYQTLTASELSQGFATGNFTEGVNNISAKLPTVLLVAAIVLILGILAVLVGVWQRMRFGNGASI